MNKQTGFYFTLTSILMMAIMLVTTLSLVRSSHTSTIISGNISFKHSAVLYSDIGMALASTQLAALANYEANVAGSYYATEQAIDVNGIPATVDWSTIASTTQGQFSLQQVTERLCTGALPIADQLTQCMTFAIDTPGSNNVGSQLYSPPASVYFRVTTRVTGPRNTVTYVQGILMR